MARYGPEGESEGNDANSDQKGHPDSPSNQETLYVRLADTQSSEGCGFGLTEEDKDGIEFILMGD